MKAREEGILRTLLVFAISFVCAVTAIALAETAPLVHIRGTVVDLDGQSLVVTTREGPKVTVNVPETARISSLKTADVSAISAGTFIGTAAKPGPDNTLQAIEVLIFPDSARGTAEGHYSWDLAPGTTMTNATVTAVVESRSGRDLTLAYKGGNVRVVVPPDAPIVTPVPAARSDLNPGAVVFVAANKDTAGNLVARFIAVSKDGVLPPM